MTGRIRLLSIVAVLLLGLLVLDRLFGIAPETPPPSTTDPAALAPAAGPALAALPAALADHPLFQPSRASANADPAAPSLTGLQPPLLPEPSTPPPAPEVLPVLLGVVTSPPPGGAFVGDTAGGPTVYLEPGEESRGLHLMTVASDRAVFHGPDGDVTLFLPTAIELGKQ
ncbi:hypothetical protein [Paragemmobacter straminiformis]|uniref:Type II secretion system protein GspC N-terminal domain-containing protein n=1 Tax=Paragemmobacter straminiformis TaxID=2045119 RepID=A0A842IA67_9RHOB|nr:hypothetical protein [Gemmobacter straminiformis]MBC2836535.1 hypothetical protein [Gemmobacter straminiformis]